MPGSAGHHEGTFISTMAIKRFVPGRRPGTRKINDGSLTSCYLPSGNGLASLLLLLLVEVLGVTVLVVVIVDE